MEPGDSMVSTFGGVLEEGTKSLVLGELAFLFLQLD